MSDSLIRRIAPALAVAVIAIAFAGIAEAKSLYVVASHDGTFSAYNINADGSVTWQANVSTNRWGPAGLAVHSESEIVFATYEGWGWVQLVDADTMLGVDWVQAPGATDLAGIDVDDINDVVYAADRWTDNLYAYDWDALTLTLTLKAGYPIDLPNCTQGGYYRSGTMGIALDEIKGLLYVACVNYPPYSGTVRVYDVNTWTETMFFTPAIPPVGIAVDRIRGLVYSTAPAGGCAWAPNSYTLLSRYDLATATETVVDMGHGGMGLAVDELTGYVYVTGGCDGDDLSVWDNNLWMMQTTGPIGSPAGLTTGNVSYNPLNLTKDDGLGDDGCAVPGWAIAYRICYDNEDNPFDVTGVTLADDLPAEVAWVDGGSYDPVFHRASWALGDLAAGATTQCVDLEVKLDVSAVPESVFTNLVTIDSDQTPPTTIELETEVCPLIPVPFDVKPTSCRNPLNTRSKGVLPAAVVGADDFDVTHVDPASLTLEGVAALRWSLEDVTAPYVPYLGKQDPFDCTTAGPDGYLDLTVKFDKQAVVQALGDVSKGDVLILTLTGHLKPEHGGIQILGEDVMVVVK